MKYDYVVLGRTRLSSLTCVTNGSQAIEAYIMDVPGVLGFTIYFGSSHVTRLSANQWIEVEHQGKCMYMYMYMYSVLSIPSMTMYNIYYFLFVAALHYVFQLLRHSVHIRSASSLWLDSRSRMKVLPLSPLPIRISSSRYVTENYAFRFWGASNVMGPTLNFLNSTLTLFRVAGVISASTP